MDFANKDLNLIGFCRRLFKVVWWLQGAGFVFRIVVDYIEQLLLFILTIYVHSRNI